ncbi:MAG: hypothetical protein Tsb0016_22950 [Sphingomonadales bacterium]
MEEILASIRRIISEDSDQPAAKAGQGGSEPEDDLPVEDEMTAEPEYAEEPEEIFEPEPEPEPEPEFEPEPVSEPEAEAEAEEVLELTDIAAEAVSAPEVESIISSDVASQTSEKFEQLSGLLVRRYPGAENTLEGLVREMLRPMLKEWLDANLPPMVEEMVAREIARITRGKA